MALITSGLCALQWPRMKTAAGLDPADAGGLRPWSQAERRGYWVRPATGLCSNKMALITSDCGKM